MGVFIHTAATDPALATVAQVRAKEPFAELSDGQLGELIVLATVQIDSLVGFSLIRQRYRETLGNHGRRLLLLSRWPLFVDGSNPIEVRIEGTLVTDWVIEAEGEAILARTRLQATWLDTGGEARYLSDGTPELEATYTAGLAQGDPSIMAGLIATISAINDPDRLAGLQKMSADGFSESYGAEGGIASMIPPAFRAQLASAYRRRL